jgi:putative glutamate/gamma-aminobutyrate antiporter
MEMNAIHVQEVSNPSRNYPIAILLAALGTVAIFVLGTLAIAFIIPRSAINLTQSLLVAYFDMFKWAGIGWLAPVMAIALAIGVLAGVVTWVAGPSSGLLVVSKAGYMPRFWQKTNVHGMATNILLVQAFLVTVLSILFVVLPSVQAAYQILSQLTVILYLVMYLLMFAAGIYLRYSQPNRPRPYRIPGGDIGMWLIGGLGFVGSLLAFILSFIPPGQISVGSPITYVGILIALTVFFVAIPFVIYWVRKPHWRDPDSDFAPFTWEAEGGHPGVPTSSSTATSHLLTTSKA